MPVGISIAISSSVAVVNIIRSRRRTTDRATEEALLGWAVLQDLTGAALAALVVAGLTPSVRPAPRVAVCLGGPHVGVSAVVAPGGANP